MQDEHAFRVEPDRAGQRLDVFLTLELPRQTRSRIKTWIDAGAVDVDGRREKAGYRLRAGEEVRLRPPPEPPSELIPEPLPLQILYEDEQLAVIDKPAGLVVHPGAGHPSGTLANALLHHFGQLEQPGSLRPGLVHRLDKPTSGVLLVAKGEQVREALAAQFRRRQVRKLYLALVYGLLDPPEGTIDAPLGRHPRDRTRISTHARKARPALTSYRVRRRYEEFSYLEVRLHTGRTHQIRVHLNHLGHPVVGDATYGAGRVRSLHDPLLRKRVEQLGRHFLHAWKLEFRHPGSGETVRFTAPLPAALLEFLESLE